jgi:hypothetical protein
MQTVVPRAPRLYALVFALALGSASCDRELLSPEYERILAEKAAMEFVARHRDEWRVHVRGIEAPAVLELGGSCDTPGGSGLNGLLLAHRETRLTLYFDCPIASGATAADLSAALAFVVIDELPHGIASPGWQYAVQTPSSSVTNGVTLGVAAGRLTVDVDTPLFAVTGFSERAACLPAQDDLVTPECYVHRAFRVPLRLTFSVPYPR